MIGSLASFRPCLGGRSRGFKGGNQQLGCKGHEQARHLRSPARLGAPRHQSRARQRHLFQGKVGGSLSQEPHEGRRVLPSRRQRSVPFMEAGRLPKRSSWKEKEVMYFIACYDGFKVLKLPRASLAPPVNAQPVNNGYMPRNLDFQVVTVMAQNGNRKIKP